MPTYRRLAACLATGALSSLLAGGCVWHPFVKPSQPSQPVIDARASSLLYVDGYHFKDLNKNGRLDRYEDWRQPVSARVDDLVAQMTAAEKAGMLLIDTLNANSGGAMSDSAVRYIRDEKMTRFIFRNPITRTPAPNSGNPWIGAELTPREAAQFMNLTQETAESTRLGIPLLFKSNARNHIEPEARFGINTQAGAFSAWPKEAGLAATRDMDLIADFARTMRAEWTAIGIRGMYGYGVDLATEPRWFRVHETFSEDADLVADIATTLIGNLQGSTLGPNSVALTMKHFPGGGPQEGGRDPHYPFGKRQVYPTGSFDYQLKPFRAAIDSGVAALMPYYGIPVGQTYQPNDVGMAFSKGIVGELLRDELGFDGVVNSDTGIIQARAWGLEEKSIAERLAIAIDAGNDVFSGFHENHQILDLIESGKVSEQRLDQSVRRLLTVQFELGLFENPYVDPDRAEYLLGNPAFRQKALLAQRKSIVLLRNENKLLPLQAKDNKPLRIYTLGIDTTALDTKTLGFELIAGDSDTEKNGQPTVPSDAGAALIRVVVNNQGADKALMFGGANEEDVGKLTFSEMAEAKSWHITPSLADIRSVMDQVGAEKTILSIYFRQPYVLDRASGLRQAGALLATFGVSDEALLDVIAGRFAPTGRLPFALAKDKEAIERQAPDAPGYEAEDTLFPFDWGLSYPGSRN